MDEQIVFAQDMVKCLCGAELHVIPNTKEAFLDYLAQSLPGLTLEQIPQLGRLVHYQHLQPDCVYEFCTVMNLRYLAFSSHETQHLFLLGPSLTQSFSKSDSRLQLRQLRLSPQAANRVLHYFSKLPVVPSDVLHRLCILLIRHFTKSTQPISHQVIDLPLDVQEPPHLGHQEELAHMRTVEARYEMSIGLTEAVKQGNLSMAIQLLGNYQSAPDDNVRNADPLRNFQNYCIVLNTQLRHGLEDCGIHPYRLDRISHSIGLEIEQLRSLEHSAELVFSVIQRYCRLVHESAYPNCKPLILLAVTYIKEHLTDNLSVRELSQIMGVNANYLSDLFHQEMGVTPIEFINRERCRQAAALLRHTNLQIQRISAIVGYNNTSYFARQFAKEYHQSPRAYRAGEPV